MYCLISIHVEIRKCNTEKKKYMDICIYRFNSGIFCLDEEESSDCNCLKYLFTTQYIFIFLYAFPLEYYVNKTTDNIMERNREV